MSGEGSPAEDRQYTEDADQDGQQQQQSQQPSQGGQPPQRQGQPRGGQPRRQEPQGQSDSVTDDVNTDEVVYIVGVFGLIGAGIGLAGILGPLVGNEITKAVVKGIVALAGLSVAIAGGPLVGVLTALGLDERMDETGRPLFLTAGLAGVVGHLVMVVLTAVLLSVGAGGGDGRSGGGASQLLGSLGDFIVSLVLIAVATGLVTAGAAYFKQWNRRRQRM